MIRTDQSQISFQSRKSAAAQMARIIQKGSGKDVLETIGWKEFVVIYVQSVIFNVFIVCKNVLWSLKQSLDTRIGSTRRVIAHKFPMLSLIKGAPVARVQQSVACPAQLLDPQLGQHKYMKLKVSEKCGAMRCKKKRVI